MIFLQKMSLPLHQLQTPLTAQAVDGHPLNTIRYFTICEISIGGHVERLRLLVIDNSKFDIVLGLDWLRTHNPSIDWDAGTLALNRCPCSPKERTAVAFSKYVDKGKFLPSLPRTSPVPLVPSSSEYVPSLIPETLDPALDIASVDSEELEVFASDLVEGDVVGFLRLVPPQSDLLAASSSFDPSTENPADVDLSRLPPHLMTSPDSFHLQKPPSYLLTAPTT
jgi:Retroviral aspartyl protease